MTDSYLRYPHLHGDLVTFVAEDDVWLAPIDGGRAWRVSADQAGASSPRFSPDGSQLAWTSWRDVEPEVHLAPTDGGPSRRLTYWGDVNTEVIGWAGDGSVLATSSVGQPSIRRSWVHEIAADGSGSRRLSYGPVGGLAFGPDGAVLLLGAFSREPAWWKRYRGGTAGKLWLDADGDGEFVRFQAELDGNLSAPMWVGDRLAFLSDHEGVADLYSCAPDGTDLRRHQVPGEFYARNATTDGTRVIFHRAGRLWLVDGLDAEPRELDVRLGGRAAPARPTRCGPPTSWARSAPTTAGGAARSRCAAPSTGSPTATARSGCSPPSRACGPGCRARSASRSSGSPTPTARTRWRSRRSTGSPRARRRGGSGPGSWAGCSSWPRPRTAGASRSPPTTAGCCWSTLPPASCARSPAARTATRATSRSPPTPAGWPGRTRGRSRCGTSGWPAPPTCP
ncbi:hypothetical protein [Actinophytocola sp.]|uniref:hypothetical protein n=1 Tax=Actinophytocola sp. TaxID=1872138 RepID=UPI0025B88582|nr:hypothetical protein [Actinophytocola sp.]